MRRSSERLHPGARLFGNALASIKSPTGKEKMKSKDAKIAEVPSPVSLQSYPVSVVEKTHHLPLNVGNFHTSTEDDYSLPMRHPDQSSIPYHPGVYQSSDVYSLFYPSTTSQFGSSTNHSSDVFGSSTGPCRTSMTHFGYSGHHSSPFHESDGGIYNFSCSSLSNDRSELSPNIFTDPEISSRMSPGQSDASEDYRLPLTLTLPASAPDSGYPSSDDGNSSESSVPDCSMLGSMSYYHVVNSSKSFSETTQASHCKSPAEVVPEPQMLPATLQSRVNRRVMSRIQEKRTSIGKDIRKSISMVKNDLPSPFPEYTVTEDSDAKVSSDEDSSHIGCTSCEKQSEELRRDDSRKQWRALPDYSPLDFLTLKSETGFIDSHCHLDFLFDRQNYDGTYADYMQKHKDTYPATYEGCVAVFCNPRTFHKKTMWQRYLNEKGVWGAFGCHPHNANAYSDLLDSDLCSALRHTKVRALGEIGLDYSNRNDCSKKTQHVVFRRQLKIALSKKLPLVIHCRDANEDCMDIMKEILPKDYTVHLHCFTDSWDWAQKWLMQFPNLFIGITNLVTYNSAEPTHEVARKIPLDRLLLETDAPYFVPRTIPRSTKWSHPGMAVHVAAQISSLRNLPLREIIHRTRQNTRTVYGI